MTEKLGNETDVGNRNSRTNSGILVSVLGHCLLWSHSLRQGTQEVDEQILWTVGTLDLCTLSLNYL